MKTLIWVKSLEERGREEILRGWGGREGVKEGEDALSYTTNTLLSYTNSFYKHNWTPCPSRIITIIHVLEKFSSDQKVACRKSDITQNLLIQSFLA